MALSAYYPGFPFPTPSAVCDHVQELEADWPTSDENPKQYCSSSDPKMDSSKHYLSEFEPPSLPEVDPCYSVQEAIIQNDTTFIEQYLSTGGNIDTTDLYGKTLLHYAIETGQIDTIDFLLTKGANVYGPYYDLATGLGYESTPLFAAYQLQNDCEFAPALCTAIVNIIGGAAASVDADSTSISNNMANDNVSGIINTLASGTAIHGKTMEQLNWYALENNDLTLFTASSQHPSCSLSSTAEEFVNVLLQNKTQYQSWINLIRYYFNRSFYTFFKYSCIDWECAPENIMNSLLILACAQGNLDLVNFLLPLGADPTVQVTEEETLLEYIGKDWSPLGFTFPWVLPDWPTDKDTEIVQALQAYVASP